jgi:MoxR-like ATPase
MDESVANYMLEIVHRTREAPELSVGVSTRGALLWHRAIQALAFVEGRGYSTPDDVKSLAVSVCAHRVMMRRAMHGASRNEAEGVIRRIVSQVDVP